MGVLLLHDLEHGVRVGLPALDGKLPAEDEAMAALMPLVQGLRQRQQHETM